MTSPHLHVYGPAYWHCDADLVGDKEALRLLKATIDEALISGYAETVSVFSGDGEGYRVRVLVADTEDICAERFPLPYHDDCARERRQSKWGYLGTAMAVGKEEAR